MIPKPTGKIGHTQTIDQEVREDREWWRWYFAGQIAAAALLNGDAFEAKAVVSAADILIAALEEEL